MKPRCWKQLAKGQHQPLLAHHWKRNCFGKGLDALQEGCCGCPSPVSSSPSGIRTWLSGVEVQANQDISFTHLVHGAIAGEVMASQLVEGVPQIGRPDVDDVFGQPFRRVAIVPRRPWGTPFGRCQAVVKVASAYVHCLLGQLVLVDHDVGDKATDR